MYIVVSVVKFSKFPLSGLVLSWNWTVSFIPGGRCTSSFKTCRKLYIGQCIWILSLSLKNITGFGWLSVSKLRHVLRFDKRLSAFMEVICLFLTYLSIWPAPSTSYYLGLRNDTRGRYTMKIRKLENRGELGIRCLPPGQHKGNVCKRTKDDTCNAQRSIVLLWTKTNFQYSNSCENRIVLLVLPVALMRYFR